MSCDVGKGMMESMQIDKSMQMNKEEELLQQQPNQQQPQPPGAANPDPWPSPMPAGLEERNSEWETWSHDFLVIVLGGRAREGEAGLPRFSHSVAAGGAGRGGVLSCMAVSWGRMIIDSFCCFHGRVGGVEEWVVRLRIRLFCLFGMVPTAFFIFFVVFEHP